MKAQFNALLCMLTFFPQSLLAQSPTEVEPNQERPLVAASLSEFEGVAEQADREKSLIDLLEFLGEFENKEGEWLNPDMFVEDNFNQLDQDVTLDDDND